MSSPLRGAAAAALLLCACTDSAADSAAVDSAPDDSAASFTLSSSAFEDGGDLPESLKCERDGGTGESPPLSWDGAPAETHSFALTMTYYPGADGPPNAYWLLWGIPADATELAQGNAASVGVEGSDKDGVSTGYTSPCSPSADEVHDYTISLFALSEDPGLGSEDDVAVNWDALTAAIDGLTLDAAAITVLN